MLTCAILAFTRKHLNLKVIWTDEMVKLTTIAAGHLKSSLGYIEQKYAESFPDHAKSQEKLAAGRQRLECPPAQKSVDLSSCKVTTMNRVAQLASATTHPTTHHVSSEASLETKYGISACQFEHLDTTLKKEEDEHLRLLADRHRSYESEQENDFAKGNINDHFNKVAEAHYFDNFSHQYLDQHEAELHSSKKSTQRLSQKQKSSEALKKSLKAPLLPIGPSASTARIQYQRDASRKKLAGQTFDLGRKSTHEKLQTSYGTTQTSVLHNSSLKTRGIDEKRGSTKYSHQQILLKNAIANYSHLRTLEPANRPNVYLD